MAEWRTRPLDSVYSVVFIDAVHVKIRDGHVANRPVYVAVAVTADGYREILGLWAGDGGEGATYWQTVLNWGRRPGTRFCWPTTRPAGLGVPAAGPIVPRGAELSPPTTVPRGMAPAGLPVGGVTGRPPTMPWLLRTALGPLGMRTGFGVGPWPVWDGIRPMPGARPWHRPGC